MFLHYAAAPAKRIFPNQVAILHKPSAVVIDQPSFPVPQKPLFAFQLFVHVGFPPAPVVQMDARVPSVFVRCPWDGNQNDASALFMRKAVHLDSNYFIGSIFSNVAVAYDGGLSYFDDSNRIVNSTLFIGPDVKRDDKAVQHLVKAFPWLEPH